MSVGGLGGGSGMWSERRNRSETSQWGLLNGLSGLAALGPCPVSSSASSFQTGRYLMGSRSRMASPSRDDRMTNTISYPVTRSLSPANPSTDELRAELEAVKRETARLRRELV